MAAVAPKFAVVPVGDGNQFGHPVESVVARYAAAGVRFLRTDRDGEVTALTDGKTLTVQTATSVSAVDVRFLCIRHSTDSTWRVNAALCSRTNIRDKPDQRSAT